jgi:hypothetical protein
MTDTKKITQLTPGVTLTGNELFEMVQAGDSRSARADQFPLATDPFITVSSVGLLPNSRYLDAGVGITLTDGGAGSTLTITATGVTFDAAAFVVLSLDGVFPNERVLTGTANQVILTDGGPLGNITLSLPQSIATTSSPTFANLTLSNPLPPASGGTGIASYAVGDLLYASGATTLAKLADVAAGSYLRSGGVTTAPVWSTTTLPNSATAGDLVYASAANTYSNLADVAAGSFLRSGGVGVAPVWSTTTIPNAATTGDILYASAPNTWSTLADVAAGSFLRSGGVTTAPLWSTTTWPNAATQGDLIFASAANAFTVLAKDANATRYLSNTGTTNNPAWAQVDLSNGVTGDLPFANLTQIAGLSVLGVAGNVTADVAAITAASDGDILRRSGTSIGFGAIALTAVNFANPTASVGLAAVNGTAVTAMRSDGAPALSQTITPTWTGLHTYTNATRAVLLSSASPILDLNETDGAANNRLWRTTVNSEQLLFQVVDDAVSTTGTWLTIDRTLNVIDNIGFTATAMSFDGLFTITKPQTAGPVTSALYLNSASPAIGFRESDAAADNRLWDILANAEQLLFRTATDAAVANNWMLVDRTGSTIDNIQFGAAIRPFTDGAQNLGQSAVRWGTVFATTLSDGASANAATVTTTGTSVLFGSGSSWTQNSSYTSGNERIRIASGGNIFMISAGTTGSAANAFINNASSPVNELLRSTSSRRYKRNIEDIEEDRYRAVMALRPVWYRSKCENDPPDYSYYGLIAEEVAEIDPRLVHWAHAEDDTGTLIPDGVMYDRVAVLTHGIVQRHAEQLRAMEARIRTLESA